MKTYRTLTAAASLLALLAPSNASADTLTLTPVADTSLFSFTPDNNGGAALSLAAGVDAAGRPIRALLRFNPTASIPSGAAIQQATLQLTTIRMPAVPESGTFQLHSAQASWIEGTGSPGASSGVGSAATAGEVTWNSRAHDSQLWSAPGGESGTDFAATPIANASNTGLEPLVFESTPGLIADVQLWLDNPAANFGWFIKEQFESAGGTARRFASREDAAQAPTLTIEFNAPLRIRTALDGSGNICFHFTAAAGKTYRLQRRQHLDTGDWNTVATREPGDAGDDATLCEPVDASSNNFYRLSEE